MADPLTVTSHDLSCQGAGIIVDRQLVPGETIEVTFIMPDNAEELHARGTVVWVQNLGLTRYRAGILLPDADIKPIPIVLRSIKVRTSRYSG
jgi:hypothetical protein